MSHIPSSCDKKLGGRVLLPSCILQFENYHFYNVESPPSAFAPPPPPPPTGTTRGTGSGRKRTSVPMVIAIAAPISILSIMMLFVATYCFLRRRFKKDDTLIAQENDGKEISIVESLQYNLSQIQAATNNFCVDQKIGEGGFGSVYKGTLPNGQEIAVKRLFGTSWQVAKEFKNEIALVAELQHRNLVRLLGFCFEGEEKILIYEYVPNKTLHYVLFEKQHMLDWSRRQKIIGGIARGLLYMHQDSRLRIIHRDLKASNVLLDADMEPKIADFGLARIFGVDQSKANTSRIAGTYGYMAPEYVRDGQFSVKTDVFSFGVLVLEIIIGKTSRRFYESGTENLLSYAWKNWRNSTPLAMLDPALGDSYARDEVILCIHVGLLCVQEDIKLRPTMASVVLMLNSHAVVLPTPRQPAFLLSSESQSTPLRPASVDDAPITEAHPR